VNYAKTYCELKASLRADIATVKAIRGRLRAYEQSSEKDAELIAKTREELRVKEIIVKDEKTALSKLESELKKMSSDLDDVELKVFTLHYIKGYKLKKIAKKLYFSYSRVKQINKRIKEKMGLKDYT